MNARGAFVQELRGFEKRVRDLARDDERTRRLMTVPGVGVLVSLTFVSAIDDPDRFRSSRMVGPHFGLTPSRYQSGETDRSCRISKVGDTRVRAALYEAANVILTHRVKSSDLKTWALAVARRAGMRKAKVALARKLAVVLHRMLRDQSDFVSISCRHVRGGASVRLTLPWQFTSSVRPSSLGSSFSPERGHRGGRLA